MTITRGNDSELFFLFLPTMNVPTFFKIIDADTLSQGCPGPQLFSGPFQKIRLGTPKFILY